MHSARTPHAQNREWADGEYARSTSTKTMYGACRARWLAAKNYNGQGASRRIAGVFYNQGFGDAGKQDNAIAWAERFTQLVADIRSDVGDANLPVVFLRQILSPQCEAVQLGSGPYLHKVWIRSLFLRSEGLSRSSFRSKATARITRRLDTGSLATVWQPRWRHWNEASLSM